MDNKLQLNEMTAVFGTIGYRIQHPDNPSQMEQSMVRTWGDGDRTWQIGLCMVCGGRTGVEPVAPDPTDIYTALATAPITVCPRCMAMTHEHYHDGPMAGQPRETDHEFKGDWEKTCPRLFAEMAEGRVLPHYIDERSVAEVRDWRPSCGHGMVLIGSSGTGKTFSLWLLKRELEKIGTRCDIYTAVEMARELSKHARDLDAAVHLWKTAVLCIDDMGKEPITAAASALLWELVDRRYGARVPTIITTRFKGEAFTERFRESSLGHDIRRRIKDSCVAVNFKNLKIKEDNE